MGAIGIRHPAQARATSSFKQDSAAYKLANYENIKPVTAENILQEAEKLQCIHRINGARIIDLKAYIKKSGLNLKEISLEGSFCGYICKENKVWTIGVNSEHPATRQRFTIAHELGHYCLHIEQKSDLAVPGFKDTEYFRNKDYGPKEKEANTFAAELLMPAKDIACLVKKGIRRVNDLAKTFRVSGQAMHYRLENLGYVLRDVPHE